MRKTAVGLWEQRVCLAIVSKKWSPYLSPIMARN